MAKPTKGNSHQEDGALQAIYLKSMEDLETVFSNAVGQMLMTTASTQQQLQVMAEASTTQDVMLILSGGNDHATPIKTPNKTKGGVS